MPSVNINELYFFSPFKSTVSSWQCIHAILSCACLDDAYPLIWRLFCNVNFYYSLETTTSRRERSMKRFHFRAPFQTGSSHPNPWTVYLVSCNALKICKRAICRSSSQTVFYFWFFKTNFQIVNEIQTLRMISTVHFTIYFIFSQLLTIVYYLVGINAFIS